MNPFENPIQVPEKISFKVSCDGDQYDIDCPTIELLEETIKKIAVAFNIPSHEHQEIVNTIMQGDDWRFEGTFDLKLQNNMLVFYNQDGKGVKENRQQIKEVVGNL